MVYDKEGKRTEDGGGLKNKRLVIILKAEFPVWTLKCKLWKAKTDIFISSYKT